MMHQLKPVKQNMYPKSKQLDGMNYIFASNNACSSTSGNCKICIATQNLLSDSDFYAWQSY